MFSLCQLSHVCGRINATRSSNFRGSYNIVIFSDLLMAMKLVGGEFSFMAKVCRMASLCLSVSWSGHGVLGIGTHPALIKVLLRWGFQLCRHFSHTSLVFSALWYSGNAVSPEHAGFSLSLPTSGTPFPWWERGPSHWEGSVMCHLLFAEGGCCLYWAILSVNRNMRCNIHHTENYIWVS